MKIAIACGGTGGHMFPGIACGHALRERGHAVDLWLAGRDVETTSVQGWPGGVHAVPSAGFQGGLLRGCGVCGRLAAAVVRAMRVRRRTRPDVMLAMGSYASVGPSLAARAAGVPLVLHESNAVPGRAVAFLAPFAAAVGVAFPEAAERIRCRRKVVTGMPPRTWPSTTAAWMEGLDADRFTVLIMGGSQGAHRLNELACAALCGLREAGEPVQVIHLAGARDAAWVAAAYERCCLPHRVFTFLPEVNLALQACDMAVTRAGAATCFELAEFTVPALLVPLPSASRGHQLANARAFARAGAAQVLEQDRLSAELLAGRIRAYRCDSDRLQRMRAALSALAVPRAAEALADLVEDVAGRKNGKG